MKDYNISHISPRELYDMSVEEVLNLEGYVLNSLENGVLKQIFINKGYIYITEEGDLNWYPYFKEDGEEVERVASYKHNITYYLDEPNNFIKAEGYEYYINPVDEDIKGFGSLYKEVDDLSEEEDYSKEEDCTTLQEFWEIIRDEFIDPYRNEWKVDLYNPYFMDSADENFTE